ncbi:MAG: RNA 2',3'-cyclic phosphodiesterase [bacterium]|nr:RNA 2',3'-cyclic phosphodiesterase [Candidatus Neomarinimicrobiota bacterium]MDD3966798.1 RNA 2',3'-cyclic phosphodiesterase [Candidatus Neomarinimicrobiota bacterium]MDX9780721.1 RNA 2',3'-cyclic phosphodiesterase [bacterium]
MDFKRTFIGIPLPEVLRDRLDAIRRELMPISKGLVWVRPELMHITIKFLGETPERMMDSVREVFLSSTRNFRSLKLKLHETGYFPLVGEPRVLWAGLQNIPGEFYRLSDELNTAYVSLGFDDSGKRFSPHITLARIKHKPDPQLVSRFLEQDIQAEEFFADRIIWYESVHKNGKLTYLPLEESKLLV